MLYVAFIWKLLEFCNYNVMVLIWSFEENFFLIAAMTSMAFSDNAWCDMKMANFLAYGMLHTLCSLRKLNPACFCTNQMKETSLEKV